MSAFRTYAQTVFRDIGTHLPFERLNAVDQHRLVGAMIRDSPGTVRSVLNNTTGADLAEPFARIAESSCEATAIESVDAGEVVAALWRTLRTNDDLLWEAAGAYEAAITEYEKRQHAAKEATA